MGIWGQGLQGAIFFQQDILFLLSPPPVHKDIAHRGLKNPEPDVHADVAVHTKGAAIQLAPGSRAGSHEDAGRLAAVGRAPKRKTLKSAIPTLTLELY